jgi:hypothetical protein
LEKEKHFLLVGPLSARGLQLHWASRLLRQTYWLGGPKANGPGGPGTGRVGVPARAQACGHRGHDQHSGTGSTGSPPGEVRLGVQDEHHRGGDYSSGNARKRAAHRDGGVA